MVLTAGGSAADGGVGFKKIVDGSADEFEMSICNHFSWETANFSNELFELSIDAGRTEVF